MKSVWITRSCVVGIGMYRWRLATVVFLFPAAYGALDLLEHIIIQRVHIAWCF